MSPYNLICGNVFHILSCRLRRPLQRESVMSCMTLQRSEGFGNERTLYYGAKGFGLLAVAVCAFCPAPAMVGRIPRAQLTGLAEAWEQNDLIRRRFVFEGKLLLWTKPAQMGLPSMANAKLNYDVLLPYFNLWANACTKPRTPSLEAVKKQACRVLQ